MIARLARMGTGWVSRMHPSVQLAPMATGVAMARTLHAVRAPLPTPPQIGPHWLPASFAPSTQPPGVTPAIHLHSAFVHPSFTTILGVTPQKLWIQGRVHGSALCVPLASNAPRVGQQH